jgi:uncharacterized DUF497 family protein
MEFEWDEAKSERNFRDRGFGYDFAALIFDEPVIEWCDIRENWPETRIVAVGAVEENILAVIYTASYPPGRPARRNASYGNRS